VKDYFINIIKYYWGHGIKKNEEVYVGHMEAKNHNKKGEASSNV